ncbi:hypothetical protein KQX54_020565 [Cotesia glomerata]|uniref:Uncharacterized protein n=1 Tax=Cotesia glomerata TaxID=32391 RepID=A0AAV7IGC5_COTGL|nr:hypothetical protein KQX54_020565 [Cotesia glomerata]
MTSLSPRRCNSAGPTTKLAQIKTLQDNSSSLVFSEGSSNCESQSQSSSLGTEIVDQSVGIKYKSVAVRWPKLSGRMAKSSHARFEKMNYITACYEEILSSSQSSMITVTSNSLRKDEKRDYISPTSTSPSAASTINYLWDSNRRGKWKSKSNYSPIGSDVRILSKIENELGPLRGKFSELAGKVRALNLIDVNSVFVNGHFDDCSGIKIINRCYNNNYNYNCTDLNQLQWQANNYSVTSTNLWHGHGFSSCKAKNLTKEVNKEEVIKEKYINKLFGTNKRHPSGQDVVRRENDGHGDDGKICGSDTICQFGDMGEEINDGGLEKKGKNYCYKILGASSEINRNYNNCEDSGGINLRRLKEQPGFRNKNSPAIYFNDLRMTDSPDAIPVGNKPDIYVGDRRTDALKGMTCSPEDFY